MISVHFSLAETEDYVKEKATNTNLKPVQIGKEKCDAAKVSVEEFKATSKEKSARFVLHPVLTQILEDIEEFTLGQTVIMDNADPVFSDPSCDDDCELNNENIGATSTQTTKQQSNSLFPSSNPQNTIQGLKGNFLLTSDAKNETVTSERDNASTEHELGMPAGRRTGVSTPADHRILQPLSSSTVSTPEKKSKLIIKRSKTSDIITRAGAKELPAPEVGPGKSSYRSVTGLRATLVDRSVSLPQIKWMSSSRQKPSDKNDQREEQSAIQIQFRKTLVTKAHNSACHITGVAILPKGSVIVCDNVHDSVQLFDPELKEVSEYECHQPWGTCAVSDTAIAVSMHYGNKIILLKTNNELEKIVGKDIVLKCDACLTFDVKFHAYRLYALCGNGDIHILDLKGEEYSVLKIETRMSTVKYFDIDDKTGVIAVAGENGVVTICKGSPKWQFNAARSPKMLFTGAVMDQGHVLVCDWENNRIVEVHDDGEGIRTISNDNVERPLVMAKCKAAGTLVVSQYDFHMDPEKTRQIKVYQYKNKT